MGKAGDFDALAKALEDVIGANSEHQSVTQWVDTGFEPLNSIIMGKYKGGIPFGRLIEVCGESSTGKTALATKWMVEAQKMGGVAIFIDWERSFDVHLAEGFGLDTSPGRWIYKQPETWEEGNMFASKACKAIRESGVIPSTAPIVAVFDSIAAAMPKSMADKEIDEYNMNDTTALARVTSTTLKSQANYANKFQATFVYLNQIRLKPGVVYGDPRTTPGGKAMEFYASARIFLGRQKIVDKVEGGDKEFVGQNITAQCVKSKFTRPFQECNLRLMFDEVGAAYFDTTTSLLEYMIEHGEIEYSKPRVTWTDGKKYFVKELAKKIEAEGLQGELKALLKE